MSLVAFLSGAVGWTLAEYLLHRFVFHGSSPNALGAREHRQHHARPDYFAPWWQKGLAAIVATVLLLAIVWLPLGRGAAIPFTLGFIGMYLLYEVLHRRAHTHPPRGRYGRWQRKNHFAHHFADPRRAHGVTVPWWDRVFGTRLEVKQVRVPRRLAMRWLVDQHGDVWTDHAADYVLIGSSRSDEATRRADRLAAMSNQIPTG